MKNEATANLLKGERVDYVIKRILRLARQEFISCYKASLLPVNYNRMNRLKYYETLRDFIQVQMPQEGMQLVLFIITNYFRFKDNKLIQDHLQILNNIESPLKYGEMLNGIWISFTLNKCKKQGMSAPMINLLRWYKQKLSEKAIDEETICHIDYCINKLI